MRLIDRLSTRFSGRGIEPSGAAVLTTTYGSPGNEPILPMLMSATQAAYTGNAIVFGAILARLSLFSEAEFKFRRLGDKKLFGNGDLAKLEYPWPNGTTGELLARMVQDLDLAGNAYVWDAGDQLVRLRPDWVTIVSAIVDAPGGGQYRRVLGYWYEPPPTELDRPEPMALPVEDVAHWSFLPDPMATFRGMSWLTPILREVDADNAMTSYKTQYLANAASPNLLVKYTQKLSPDQVATIRDRVTFRYGGMENAFKTMVLDEGADATVIGNTFEQMNFSTVQAAGENRIVIASGVPGIVIGSKEGLMAATYCLPGDSLVWTMGGPRPIRDLGPGDVVWSHVDGGLALRRVTWQARTGYKPVYTIRTRNRVLRASGNHPVLVRVPGSMGGGGNDSRHAAVEWRTVEQLRAGDRVVQVQHLPDDIGGEHLPDGRTATADMLRWLGAYVGDGCGAKAEGRTSIQMCIPPQDRVRDSYEKLTLDLFDVHIGDGPRSFRFSSVAVSRMLAEWGFAGRATAKRVPAWVFSLRRDLRLAFLAGLVDTDGSVDKRGSLKIQLANRPLMEDVRMLLVGCGIQCSNLYEQTYRADVLPNRGKHATYVSWASTASSADEVAQIPFADWLYRERVEANTGRRRRAGKDSAAAGLDDSLGFFTVRSIEVGTVDEPVYDIQVEEGASFVADGIVVHNSNYEQAMRRFSDLTMRPLWRSVCACLAKLVVVPAGSRLWFDTSDIAALRQGEKERAETLLVQAQAAAELVGAFEPDSVLSAIGSGDMGLLTPKAVAPVPAQLELPPGVNGNTPALPATANGASP